MIEGRERQVWVRPNGNTVVETRQHMGCADGEAYVMPFSSTGHTVSRMWMQMMNQQVIPGSGKVAPSWAKCYTLTSTERTKDGNSWYVFKVSDNGKDGWVKTKEEYERGRALYEAFAGGEKRAAAAEDVEGTASSSQSTRDSDDDAIPF